VVSRYPVTIFALQLPFTFYVEPVTGQLINALFASGRPGVIGTPALPFHPSASLPCGARWFIQSFPQIVTF